MKKILALLALLFVFQAFAPVELQPVQESAAQTYRAICTDFEGLSIGAAPPAPWQNQDNTEPDVVQNGRDGTGPQAGTRQLELGNLSTSVLTGVGIQSTHLLVGSYYTNEFLLDTWMRFNTGYAYSAGVHSNEFLDPDGGGSQWYFVTVGNTSFLFAIPESLGTFVASNMYPGGPGTSAAWFHVQYYYNQNGGNYKIWYNGTPTTAIPSLNNGDHWNNWAPLANLSTGSGWTAPVWAYMDTFQLFTDSTAGTGNLQEPITGGSMSAGTANVNGSAACAGSPAAPTYMPIRSELDSTLLLVKRGSPILDAIFSLFEVSNDENWDANDYRLAA